MPITAPTANVDMDDRTALVLSKEWLNCTDQQRLFITEYLFGNTPGKTLAATQVAYPDAKPESQKVMQYQILHSPGVAATLELWGWLGGSARTRLITLANEQLKVTESGSTAFTTLMAQIERLTIGAPKIGRRPKVDDEANLNVETQVPADAIEVWHDDDGVCLGYRDSAGKAVQFRE